MTHEYVMKLDKLEFIKGDNVQIPIEWYYENGDPIPVKFAECRFYLFPYGCYDAPISFGGKDYKLAAKKDEIPNVRYVNLLPEETLALDDNAYVYQPVLYIDEENQSRRGEGSIIFKDSHR